MSTIILVPILLNSGIISQEGFLNIVSTQLSKLISIRRSLPNITSIILCVALRSRLLLWLLWLVVMIDRGLQVTTAICCETIINTCRWLYYHARIPLVLIYQTVKEVLFLLRWPPIVSSVSVGWACTLTTSNVRLTRLLATIIYRNRSFLINLCILA